MATEFSRETSVRKVCPSPGPSVPHVKLKVIDKISFIDPATQYQEYEYSFNNTPTAPREVHRQTVDGLQVERIDKISVVDDKDFFQESLYAYLTYSEGVHLETHKRKIYGLNADGTKDYGTWIEVERVDKITFVDPASYYQEYIYELKWPDLTDAEWDYQNLTPVVTSYDGSDINPPWRLDPFQNIIGASFGVNVLVLYSGNKIAVVSLSGSTTISANASYKKTCVYSSWARYSFSWQACKTSSETVIGCIGISFVDDVITDVGGYNRSSKSNASNSLIYQEDFGETGFDFFAHFGFIDPTTPFKLFQFIGAASIGSCWLVGSANLGEVTATYIENGETVTLSAYFDTISFTYSLFAYKNNGSVDSFSYDDATATATTEITGVFESPPHDPQDLGSISVSVAGITYSKTDDWDYYPHCSVGGGGFITPYSPFLPIPDGLPEYVNYMLSDSDGGILSAKQTPFENLADNESLGEAKFHASNGKHYIQGYWVYDFDLLENKARIYFNGVEISEKLKAALEITNATEIDAIFFDIPLDRVKQFR